jgi:tRNA modification GTPase
MAFSTTDTIVAIATPPGRGGIGVVRISGPEARRVAADLITRAQPLEPRRATFTTSRLKPRPARDSAEKDATDGAHEIDHVVATLFPGPHSYTGEDVVELSAHGSPVVLRAIVEAAMRAGARLAAPGEFTLRAFLNGRLDLPQAEAVADLIEAATPLQARAAFDQLQGTLTRAIGAIDAALFDLVARLEASIDFPEEGYHFVEPEALARELQELCDSTRQLLIDARAGRLLREGLTIAIVGKPNVGKSSVFNALVGTSRAIVNSRPGTTRDLITETVDLGGLQVTLTDTAGHRSTDDTVEAEGVARSKQAAAIADLTLVVLDGSQPLDQNDRDVVSQTPENKRLIVKNKTDLPSAPWKEPSAGALVPISASTGAGIDQLRHQIAAALDVDLMSDRPTITNVRHVALVTSAYEAMDRARSVASVGSTPLSEEFVLADLQAARAAFEEVTGRRTTDDVLAYVFSRFCVGK